MLGQVGADVGDAVTTETLASPTAILFLPNAFSIDFSKKVSNSEFVVAGGSVALLGTALGAPDGIHDGVLLGPGVVGAPLGANVSPAFVGPKVFGAPVGTAVGVSDGATLGESVGKGCATVIADSCSLVLAVTVTLIL